MIVIHARIVEDPTLAPRPIERRWLAPALNRSLSLACARRRNSRASTRRRRRRRRLALATPPNPPRAHLSTTPRSRTHRRLPRATSRRRRNPRPPRARRRIEPRRRRRTSRRRPRPASHQKTSPRARTHRSKSVSHRRAGRRLAIHRRISPARVRRRRRRRSPAASASRTRPSPLVENPLRTSIHRRTPRVRIHADVLERRPRPRASSRVPNRRHRTIPCRVGYTVGHFFTSSGRIESRRLSRVRARAFARTESTRRRNPLPRASSPPRLPSSSPVSTVDPRRRVRRGRPIPNHFDFTYSPIRQRVLYSTSVYTY